MPTEGLVPREAARALKVSLSHVYHMIWAGKLDAVRKDGRWLIPTSAIAARQKARQAQHAESPCSR